MDISEIRTLTDEDINTEVEKVRAKIFKMRFQGTGENVEKGDHRALRRQVAQLLTLKRERELTRSRKAAAAGKDEKA